MCEGVGPLEVAGKEGERDDQLLPDLQEVLLIPQSNTAPPPRSNSARQLSRSESATDRPLDVV